MIQAIVLAFSTYSKIPMPKAKWDDKGMKYCICAFPLVGVVIGLLQMALWYGFVQVWKLDHMLVAISMTVLPLVVTGGIHMDGYLDTMDARMSYQPMEKKLQILKDPHMGAFACIKGAVYLLLYLGICSQFLVKVKTMDIREAWKMMIAYGMVFVYTRILSGLGVEVFRKAKKDGMVAQLSRQSDKTVIAILVVELVGCVVAVMIVNPLPGSLLLCAGGLWFLWYRHMAYREFGGVTGDLAGYFLQSCELLLLTVLTIWSLIF